MKRLTTFLIFGIISLFLFSCGGGGGAGSADTPPGYNPGTPSIIKLAPSHYTAQTNSSILFSARVLDSNGNPVPNVVVTFTNLSNIGVFNSSSQLSELLFMQSFKTSSITDLNGIARASVWAPFPGWVTIVVQVNTAFGIVRDRKIVFFSSSDIAPSLSSSLSLDVSCVLITDDTCTGNAYVVFENANDNKIAITATVKDPYGSVVVNAPLTWDTSHPSEVTFNRKDPYTNTSGQGMAIATINASILRSVDTYVNIMALSSVSFREIIHAPYNMVSILLKPVTINTTSSYLTTTNTYVNLGGTTTITANVYSSAGIPVPDNTPVDFSTTCGNLSPLSSTTTSGKATTTFTAPQTMPTGNKCTVTAKVAGTTIGSIDINITQTLSVQPSTMTLSETQTATFTIFGGVAPYSVASTHSEVTVAPTTVNASGGTFTATPSAAFCTAVAPATTCTGTATIQVRDSVGTTVTVTLTVNGT